MELSSALNVIYFFFDLLRSFISFIVENTILRGRPDLANSFSSAITVLITVTAIYILLVFVTAAKKAIGIVLLLGWGLLILSLILAGFGV
ncbi:MAG: hypothetical protein ACP5KV_03670 [Candidatus Methanomethylicaceae archaeon]